MTTKPTYDLLSVRAGTDVGTRAWLLRSVRGVRAAMGAAAEADRRMTDIRHDARRITPF